MSKLDLSKFDVLFEDENTRRALYLAGCVAAAAAFGHTAPAIAHTLMSGASHAHLSFPHLVPDVVSAHYFHGAYGFFSAAAEFSSQKLSALGHAVPAAFVDAFDQPRDFIASNFTHARSIFQEAARKSTDLATGCVGILRESGHHAANLGRAMIDMVPDDPVEAAKFFGGVLKKAAEAFGIAHSCYKAYSWLGGKLRKKAAPETAPQVVNVQINVTLAQAQPALEQAVLTPEPQRLSRMRRIVRETALTPPQSTGNHMGGEIIALLQKCGVRKMDDCNAAPAL